MKRMHSIPFLMASLLLVNAKGFTQEAFPSLESRYLNQQPPGLTPQLFAPGIVSTTKHKETEVLFLPNMRAISFTRSGGDYSKPTWMVMELEGNKWQSKQIKDSSIKAYKHKFSPDYSEIINQAPFKDIPIIGATKSPQGTFYFYVLDFTDGSGHLSYSRFIDGQYQTPIKMSSNINKGKYIAHPFIAPDESYIMWDAEKEGENTPDIFISFKNKDGSWGVAISFGDTINTKAYEQRPKVTPDGKYLFFWRGDRKTNKDGRTYWTGNPYWVDAKVIENLRPKG